MLNFLCATFSKGTLYVIFNVTCTELIVGKVQKIYAYLIFNYFCLSNFTSGGNKAESGYCKKHYKLCTIVEIHEISEQVKSPIKHFNATYFRDE